MAPRHDPRAGLLRRERKQHKNDHELLPENTLIGNPEGNELPDFVSSKISKEIYTEAAERLNSMRKGYREVYIYYTMTK